MRTIFNQDGVAVTIKKGINTGECYFLNDPEGTRLVFTEQDADATEDALLAVLLDRAQLRDDRKRVTAIKALKSGDDERGKAKRGPGRPKKEPAPKRGPGRPKKNA